LDPIGSSSQKVGNNLDFISKSEKLSADDYIKIETNQNQDSFSEQNDKDDQFLSTMNFKEDYFQIMNRRFKTRMKKDLIKLIRICVESMLKKRKQIKIVLCNEVDCLMF
jgi:hypothetical protein